MCIYDSSNSVDSFSSEFRFSLDIWCDYGILFLSSLLRFGPIFYKHWIYVPTAESILECVTVIGFTKHFDKLFMWVKGVKCTQTHTLVDLSISKTWFDVMTVVTRFKSIHRRNGRQRFHLSNLCIEPQWVQNFPSEFLINFYWIGVIIPSNTCQRIQIVVASKWQRCKFRSFSIFQIKS